MNFIVEELLKFPKVKDKNVSNFSINVFFFLVTKTPNLYDVVFVDFGNWNKVASTDIHVLLPKFAMLTAQAIPCSLAKVNK